MAKTEGSISVNPKDDFLQMMQPFDDMASQLGCAPLCINILGQLCLIATEKDFDLRVEGGENTFERLKYPESFRASLCQVSQAGYDAFTEADSCMGKIKLRSAQIPGHLKTALKILYGKDSEPDDIKAFLPSKLNAIKEIANQCQNDATAVSECFGNVIKILSELECKTLIKQGKTQEAKEIAEFNIKLEEEENRRLVLIAQQNKEDLEIMKEEAAEAKEMFKQSMDSMPSTSELIEASFVQGVCGLISGITSTITTRTMESKSTTPDAYEQAGNAINKDIDNISDQLADVLESFGNKKVMKDLKAESYLPFLNYVQKLADLLSLAENFFIRSDDGKVSFDVIAIEKGKLEVNLCSTKQLIQELKNIQDRVQQKAKQKGSPKDKLLKVFSQAIDLITKIQKERANDMLSDKHFYELADLVKKVDKLLEIVKKICDLPHFHLSGPGMKSAAPQSQSDSLPARLVENYQHKVEMTRSSLEFAQKALKEGKRKQMEVQKELQESMRQLKDFKQVESSSVNILIVIQKGLKAFATLREQWSQLVQFFRSISNLIQCSLSPQLNNFVNEAEEMSKMSKITKLSKEIVYQSAFQSVKIGHIVNHLANCYLSISKEHLMPLVLQLFQLIILDKDSDKQQIKVKKITLEQGAKDAHDAIIEIINRQHTEYKLSCDRKMQIMDKEMKAIGSGIPEERVKEIRKEAEEVQKKIDSAIQNEEEIDLDGYC